MIEDESISGFIHSLDNLLNESYQKLQDKAYQGQLFAFQEKNNVAQTKRVISWTTDKIGVKKL